VGERRVYKTIAHPAKKSFLNNKNCLRDDTDNSKMNSNYFNVFRIVLCFSFYNNTFLLNNVYRFNKVINIFIY